MATLYRSNENSDIFEIHDADGYQGMLMHLATLEFDEKTYLALGSVEPIDQGAKIGIVMVRESTDENGENVFDVVIDPKELSDVVPRFIEAFAPGAEVNMTTVESSYEDDDSDGNSTPFIFDYSGTDEFLS